MKQKNFLYYLGKGFYSIGNGICSIGDGLYSILSFGLLRQTKSNKMLEETKKSREQNTLQALTNDFKSIGEDFKTIIGDWNKRNRNYSPLEKKTYHKHF